VYWSESPNTNTGNPKLRFLVLGLGFKNDLEKQKFSGAMLRCYSGALCLNGTTPIHPELGGETFKGLTNLSEV
jgi:hypothetical protein